MSFPFLGPRFRLVNALEPKQIAESDYYVEVSVSFDGGGQISIVNKCRPDRHTDRMRKETPLSLYLVYDLSADLRLALDLNDAI